MIYTFRFLTDSIFPPTKHELLLRRYSDESFTHFYTPKKAFGIVYLSHYHIPAIQAAVTACKFENNYHAAKLLGLLTSKYIGSLPPNKTLLIAVPLSKKRFNERGFNQVDRVLGCLSKSLDTSVSANIITRVKHTQPQTSLHKKDRQKNILGAFAVNMSKVQYIINTGVERVIICDDVLTTGSTLNEVRATLAPHLPDHVEIICLAWAH